MEFQQAFCRIEIQDLYPDFGKVFKKLCEPKLHLVRPITLKLMATERTIQTLENAEDMCPKFQWKLEQSFTF